MNELITFLPVLIAGFVLIVFTGVFLWSLFKE